ncbi:hypothetical protein QT711_18270 [Sporosarcina saromensis]|uniref:Uncharacterized protein n=1 Tax=Sporosarcina saromensis TaxID=359365 RepID=A0ABU4GDQ9_9BACL|nr:hypothetical protein [Sporosarcina saromensis]MDW0115110.1 hypothetical protein [Sporosarcina saromensis]
MSNASMLLFLAKTILVNELEALLFPLSPILGVLSPFLGRLSPV